MIQKDGYEEIGLVAENLVSRTQSDFAAIALPVERFGKTKWDIVVGSRNGRIKQMKIKPGIGLGGMVLRHGIIYLANRHQPASMRWECPVMLSEKLESCLAFPLPSLSGGSSACGVFLLGRRAGMFMDQDIAGIRMLIEEMLISRWFGRYDETTIR